MKNHITHKGYNSGDVAQEIVQYAYDKGGMDLVTLIECENGSWDMYKKASGKEDSRGLCMINRRWHKNIVDTKEFREDWHYQVDKCNELMNNGTKFFGPSRMIKGVRCSDYVKNRFILE